MSTASTVTVPVYLNFDSNKQVGTLTIDPEVLPKEPTFVFSLGVDCLNPELNHDAKQYIGPYELACVGLVSQQNYVRYLEHVGALPSSGKVLSADIAYVSDQVQHHRRYHGSARRVFALLPYLRSAVVEQNVRRSRLAVVMSKWAYNSLIDNEDFVNSIDPSCDEAKACAGYPGSIYGMDIMVDPRPSHTPFISVVSLDNSTSGQSQMTHCVTVFCTLEAAALEPISIGPDTVYTPTVASSEAESV